MLWGGAVPPGHGPIPKVGIVGVVVLRPNRWGVPRVSGHGWGVLGHVGVHVRVPRHLVVYVVSELRGVVEARQPWQGLCQGGAWNEGVCHAHGHGEHVGQREERLRVR